MRYLSWRSIVLFCAIGFTTGSNLLPFFSRFIEVQASEIGSQSSQNRMIQTCTGQYIDLGMPQMSEAELNALVNCGSRTIPQLLEALNTQDWKIKVIATHALGLFGIGAQEAIPALSKLMQDENTDVQFVAAQALGEIGTAAVVPALTQALQDEDENVQVSAVTALQQVGNAAQQAKPVLIDALWDSNWYVRTRAAATLSDLGLNESDISSLLKPWRDGFHPDTGAIVSLMIAVDPAVHQQVQDVSLFFIKPLQNANPNVRENAAIALGEISSTTPGAVYLTDSINALLKAVQDEDPKVRQRVIQSLGNMPFALQGKELSEARRSNRIANDQLYAPTIAKIQAALLQALQDSESDVRRAAIVSLGRVSNKTDYLKTISALLKAFQTSDPIVRQAVVSSLGAEWLDRIESSDEIPPSQKLQLSHAISSVLTAAIHDQDAEVRREAVRFLDLETLVKILTNRDENVEVRRAAIANIATGGRYDRGVSINDENWENVANPLNEALQDPDLIIRLNTAIVLQNNKKLDSKTAASIFAEGLHSDDPLIHLDAITGLRQMCPSRPEEQQGCSDAKTVLPLLIDALRDNIKPIQYAAALAVANIEPTNESGVNVLSEILLEESDFHLRDAAKNALQKIGSPYALSMMTQSLHIDDKQARYSRSCIYGGGLPTGLYVDAGPNTPPPSSAERISLLLKALENENVRFSSAETFSSIARYESSSQMQTVVNEEMQVAITGLTAMLERNSSQSENSSVLKNIFRLKNQDLRRSIVYALGNVGIAIELENIERDNNSDKLINVRESLQRNAKRLQARRKIIGILTTITNDKTDDLEVRWVAATSLQKMNVYTERFFSENNLVNPRTARWQFPHGFSVPWVIEKSRDSGFIFDIYSGGLIYDTRTGCGDGLVEIYNTLRNLINRKK